MTQPEFIYEADPLANVDFDLLASMIGIRLGRHSAGVMGALDDKLLNELSRPGQIDDFIVMLGDLSSHAWQDDGELSVRAAKSSYLLGSALALEALDSIAFDRGLSLAEYRHRMVGQADTVTANLRLDPDDNDPQRLKFYIGQAVTRYGEDSYASIEPSFSALVDVVVEGDADAIMCQPFQSAFGMLYGKGRRALVAMTESELDSIARDMAGPSSAFDDEFASLINSLG